MEEKERKSSSSTNDGDSAPATGRNANGAVPGVRSTGGGLAGIARILGSKAKGQDGPQNGTGGGSKRQKGCEDDLPLGSEAHSLSSSHHNFQSGHHEAVDKQSKMIGWQSFSSDVSNQTSASSASLEMLLNERQVDPEEVLLNLGFGLEREGFVPSLARIPERFLHHPTRASGIQIPGLVDDMESEVMEEETTAAPSTGGVAPATTVPPARKKPGGLYFWGLFFCPCEGYVDLMSLLRRDVPLYFFNEKGSKCYSVSKGKVHGSRTRVANKIGGIIKEPRLHGAVTTSQPGAVTTSQPMAVTTSQPGDATTSQPMTVTTSQPGEVTTSQPGDVTTSQPEDVTTSQPRAATTTQTKAVNTNQPGAVTTSQPGDATTSQPGDVTTTQTEAVTTSQSAAVTTSQPGAVTTSQLGVVTTSQPRAVTSSQLGVVTSSQPRAVTPRNPVTSNTSQPEAVAVRDVGKKETRDRVRKDMIEGDIYCKEQASIFANEAQHILKCTGKVSNIDLQEQVTVSHPVPLVAQSLPVFDLTVTDTKTLPRGTDTSKVEEVVVTDIQPGSGKASNMPHKGEKKLSKFLDMSFVRMAARRLGDSITGKIHKKLEASPKPNWHRQASESPKLELRSKSSSPGLTHSNKPGTNLSSYYSHLTSRLRVAPLISQEHFADVKSRPVASCVMRSSSSHDGFYNTCSQQEENLLSRSIVSQGGELPSSYLLSTDIVAGLNAPQMNISHQSESKGRDELEIASQSSGIGDDTVGMATACHYAGIHDHFADKASGTSHIGSIKSSSGSHPDIICAQSRNDNEVVGHSYNVGASGDHGTLWEESIRNVPKKDNLPSLNTRNEKLFSRYEKSGSKQSPHISDFTIQHKPLLSNDDMTGVGNETANKETANLVWGHDESNLGLTKDLYTSDFKKPPPQADTGDILYHPDPASLSSQSFVTGSCYSRLSFSTNKHVPLFKSDQAPMFSAQSLSLLCNQLKPNSHPHVDGVSGGPLAQSLPLPLSETNFTQPHGADKNKEYLLHASAQSDTSFIHPSDTSVTNTNTDTSWTHIDRHPITSPQRDNENTTKDVPTILNTNSDVDGPGSVGSHSKHLSFPNCVSSEHLQHSGSSETHYNGSTTQEASNVGELMRPGPDLWTQGAGQFFASSIKHSQSMRMPEQSQRPVVLKRRTSLGSLRHQPPPTTSLSWLHTTLASELLDQISEKDKEEIDLSNISTSSSDSEEDESKFSRSFSGEETLV